MGLLYGPDRRLTCLLLGEGGGGGALPLEELHQGDAQHLGQGLQQLQVREPLSSLPLAHRLVGHMEPVRQLSLGQALLPPKLGYKLSKLRVVQENRSFSVISPRYHRGNRQIRQPTKSRMKNCGKNRIKPGEAAHINRENTEKEARGLADSEQLPAAEQPLEHSIEGQQPIVDFGSSLIQSQRGTVHVLTIVGQIEGHQVLPPTSKSTKYEHVMPLLAMVEESDQIDGLLVLLNTVGGDIEAGLGIAELIASMSKPTVSLVLGGGHSIGVPLAVSAKRSFIAPSAAMTIHPVRLNGLVIGVPQTFYYFERVQERITQFVVANSHVKRKDFTRLMLQTGELTADVGSVIYGEEAVKLGLIDEIGGLSDALKCLHQMVEENRSAATSPP